MTILTPPDWLEPRSYQREAVEAWSTAKGQGILHMATGTGKTVTSLLAASKLAELQDGRLALIVAAPYQHLVDQWAESVEDFGLTPIKAYGSRSTWIDDAVAGATEITSGSRETFALITTHTTFATAPFQRVLERLPGAETLLIGDEVHHMGSPHIRESLPQSIRARLGLSATPERWYDEEGTDALMQYFSEGIVFEYGLAEAIENGYLCEYYYVPHIIQLTADETEQYLALSRAIGKRLAQGDSNGGGSSSSAQTIELDADESLQRLLFKRARLIGTAENKLHRLQSILEQQGTDNIQHTLVYCGDGSVEDEDAAEESDAVRRQIEAVTDLLGNELGIKAHQFTYEEDQDTRERLLADFETGDLQALAAIRCLDEGVDVPATETAFMLASSTNPRQFVQRRGRILRTHTNKDHAVIHDFIVAPPTTSDDSGTDNSTFSTERNLVKRELERVSLFAETARNHPDADLATVPNGSGSLTQLKRDFNLLEM